MALISLGMLAIFLGACGSGQSTSAGNQPLKVAFVYSGPANDGGWNQSWEESRTRAMAQFGDKVNVTVKANVSDGPTADTVMKQLVSDGYKVIFATSFTYQKYVPQLAKDHPDVKFLQVEIPVTQNNIASYDYRGGDGFYIAGMAAAATAKGNKLGVVGAYPIPSNLALLNAFQLGAQAINPNATTAVVWTNDWYDATKAQNAAQALVNDGAGALTTFTTGPSLAPVAQRSDTPWVGFEVDQRDSAPQQYLTGMLLDWTSYIQSELTNVLNNTWQPQEYVGTLQNGGVKVADWGTAYQRASEANRAKIEAAVAQLSNGSLSVYAGPIKDQAGAVRVPAGQVLNQQQIQETNYLAQGVVGSIPAGN